MSDFLRDVCAEAAERVAEARRLAPLSTLRAQPPPAAPPLGAGLRAAAGAGVAVIAELKRASPSKGHLAWIPDSPAHALAYQAGGAAAISVLTEPAHFRGTLADLSVVAATVEVPVLRKDFVVDAYQVWEARQAGASGVLLIVAALGDAQLVELLGAVTTAGLEALVEVHDEHEAGRAATALDAAGVKAPLVGINARDLTTLRVDPGRFSSCVDALPAHALTVAESGVSGPDDVSRAVRSGADAVLVGEHLVTAADPRSAVGSLVHAAAATWSPS